MKDTPQESLKRLQLFEVIEKEVKQNTVGENYDHLRKQFIDSGISSYALNLLIERQQACQTHSSLDVLDSTFFILSDSPQPEHKEKKPGQPPSKNLTNPLPPRPNTIRFVIITLAFVVAALVLIIIINSYRTVTIQTKFGYWTGPVKDNAPNGNGLLRYYDNDEQNRAYYRGEMKGWVREGKGNLHYTDSSYYNGTFNDDSINTGVFYNATEDRYYEGNWVKDMLYNGRIYEIVNNDTVILMEYRYGNLIN